MVCVWSEPVYSKGGNVVRAMLISDETPTSLPMTGEGVERLNDPNIRLDVGSVLLDLAASGRYILGSDGWHLWNP